MTVYEADLPGVGKKFEVELDDETRLVIIIHNTGKRELFLRREEGADAEKLFELTDRLARQVGTIMEGAYFQPIRTDSIDTVLADDTLIEWSKVQEGSPLAGRTLAESRLRQALGVSVIAIQRGEETLTNPDPETEIRAEDTLVVLGSRDACRKLDDVVAGDAELDG
ncbi:cation:proton antiporter regulatory subunit [Halomarina pelagica]|uniref:cation:proton antiporter regulatory subunit n=1 Tax=Halomarina pelagica TaxID=2961599 RepID=UPI0020C30633|nr:TrkA C-terminal domain-containing protein [Halomarina sp. BND7]